MFDIKSTTLTYLVLLFFTTSLFSQVNYTANDHVPSYDDGFLYGTNMGWYHQWNDTMLANIACHEDQRSLSLNALRPALPHSFLEQWGYDIRVNEFAHYESVGAINNTAFIGYPDPSVQDMTQYCNGEPSALFAGMYKPIWDGGLNGTAVNEENHYAVYLWEMVQRYKGQVRFWEVWNEPDFDYSNNYDPSLGGVAWKPPSDLYNDYTGNWWENNPQPCYTALKAPIFHYIRMLKISYEVIKTLDPDAYVAIGGIGYPSFLDAVLRNTDNPNDGSVTLDYPYKGGAYFDCLSFHNYPHVDSRIKQWNNADQDFDYFRHSDRAADIIVQAKNDFDVVLAKYHYDGQTYPKKVTILTETNIPRIGYGVLMGNDEVQRNFLIKAAVQCQKNEISQLCVYDLAAKNYPNITDDMGLSFNSMGLFENLDNVAYDDRVVNNGGIAYKTIATLLKGYDYDATHTASLNLPAKVDGGAFKNKNDEYMYVLWAKTEGDLTEYASENYSFPLGVNFNEAIQYTWNYTLTGDSTNISSQNVTLTGEPYFIKPIPLTPLPVELLSFRGYREQGDIRLEWITAHEENSDYFVVEHSVNYVDFSPLATVGAAGNTDDLTIYNHLHTYPLRGDNYYRLKQVDLNGSFSYSPIVTMSIESEKLFTIRPTHAEDVVHIEFYDYYDKDIEMDVIDVLGRVRMSEFLPAGRNAKTLDISNLDDGHYFVRMKVVGVDYFTRRFVKSAL